ncbi:MAG: hypothetical protein JSW11_08825 [Candidatus Heimdallarchaeota archaeon]|nr:MAG: hypothetical protein JSW11_08825 [Candidatus Heimdallarchaeota archaeon]
MNNSSHLYFFKRSWNKLDPKKLTIENVNQNKIKFTYIINDTVYTIVLHKNRKLCKELIRINGHRPQLAFSFRGSLIFENEKERKRKDAETKAKLLLQRIICKESKLSHKNNSVIVSSKNGKKYKIQEEVLELGEDIEEFKCVDVYNSLLPLADQCLAKALVISYRPELIDTL